MTRNLYTQRYGCITGMFMCLFMLTFSGGAAQGTEGKKNSSAINKAAMTKLQLRYATIEVPEEIKLTPDLQYTITDNDRDGKKPISTHELRYLRYLNEILNYDIGLYVNISIFEYHYDLGEMLFNRIRVLEDYNEFVKRIKKEEKIINGHETLIQRVKFRQNDSAPLYCEEHVCIEDKDKAGGIIAQCPLENFLPLEHIWQAMYHSFRFDDSQPYKLPFGSFILPKEVIDFSKIYFFIPNENDYEVEISYVSEEEANENIKGVKSTMSTIFSEAKICVMQKQKLTVDGREGRYFEAQAIVNNKTKYIAFFHITDGLNPGLEFKMIARNSAAFERYRPLMEAVIQSIKFEPNAQGIVQ